MRRRWADARPLPAAGPLPGDALCLGREPKRHYEGGVGPAPPRARQGTKARRHLEGPGGVMRYTVHWEPEAEQRLAQLWTSGPNRAAVRTAADHIDWLLERDPATE